MDGDEPGQECRFEQALKNFIIVIGPQELVV
jgi:hypothetical protein